MLPLISVIVPVYNMELYLDKCIQSVINQTYKNLEILLVDDGSTDGSLHLCKRYADRDHRIKVIHKANGGLSSARNAGLDACSGDYIGFVDSDDWIADTMYEELLSICKTRKTIATMCMAKANDNGMISRITNFSDTVITADNILRSIFLRQESSSVCCRLFPRDVIGSARFDETKLNEDILFLVSIMDNAEWASYSSSIGYYYLYREGSISRHFGKAVHDMVGNSMYIRKYISQSIPSLAKEAECYEIFQHMSFLLCCPYQYDRTSDAIYGDVLAYVRRHLLVGIKSPFLSVKEKMKLIGVAFFPRLMSKLLEMKSTYTVKKHE